MLHVDLDQFIAAVEVLRRPELAGKPVIVGGRGDPTERAVVSTASYEARQFGVGSGMPLRLAARKVPDAVILPVDAPAYAEASEQVNEHLCPEMPPNMFVTCLYGVLDPASGLSALRERRPRPALSSRRPAACVGAARHAACRSA